MMFLSFKRVSTFAISASLVTASSDPDNHFENPPDSGDTGDYSQNFVWALNDVETITWRSSDAAGYSIDLWQQNLDKAAGFKVASVFTSDGTAIGFHSFVWTVDNYNRNQTDSPVYWLWFNSNQPSGFTSHYFNISGEVAPAVTTTTSTTSTPDLVSSTSASISTSPTSALTLLTSSMPQSPTSSSSPLSASATPDSSSSSNALPIGLGVGLGVGVALLLVLGTWFGMRALGYRKRRAASRDEDNLGYEPSQPPSNGYTHDSTAGYTKGNKAVNHADLGMGRNNDPYQQRELYPGHPNTAELG